jgi:hypothetical protein
MASSQAVETERGEQAGHAVGNALAHLGEGMVLGEVAVGEEVDAATGAQEEAAVVEPLEVATRDARRLEIAGT